MTDGEQQQPEEPMRRPRGRHARRPAPVAGDGWRSKLAAAAAPVVASVEPRVAAAAEWLFERRLHVLVISATAATVVMIGGAVALISIAGGGVGPDDEVANVVEGVRPTTTQTGEPGTYAPILPSPGPEQHLAPATPGPTTPPEPGGGDDPGADEPPVEDPVEPTAEPEPEPDQPRGNPNPPGQTKKPVKP
jgi:hypothetical protein